LWIGLFDHDHGLAFDDLGFHLLLLVRFQVAFILSLLAHALHGIHHVALLRQERVAQIGGPLDVVCQALYHVGQTSQGLDAWIPRLLRRSIGERFVLQSRVLRKPLLELDDLEGIRGCRQHLGQQRVWIKGNGRHERIQLVGRNLRSLVLWRGCLRRPRGRHISHDVAWHNGNDAEHHEQTL